MQDNPNDIAFHDAAPHDERFDAQAEVSKFYATTGLPSPEMIQFAEMLRDQWEEQELLKAQSIAINHGRSGNTRPAGKGGMQSQFIDRFQIVTYGDYFERPAAMSFDGLRAMVDQTPMLASVVLTRLRQMQRFTGISEDGGIGFAIRHKDREHQLTRAEQDSINLLCQFFQNCGWESNVRRRRSMHRDSFSAFMGKIARDSLILDSAPIETEMKRDKRMGIDGFYAVDGASIRLCDEDGYQGDDRIFAVQVLQQRVCTIYTLDDLIYEPRNPRSDIRCGGYGMSECELLIRVVTGLLNAMTLNIRGFSDNAIPRGILQLVGDYDQKQLVAFKRYWNGMVKGINNAWALPIMVSSTKDSSVQFTPINTEFNEMYFSKWMTFLTSIVCAIYGMAPDEINFESFSAQKSALSGSDTAERLADSKDKGLRPLLAYFENLFTQYIIAAFDDKYVFRWIGLDEQDQEKEWEGKKLVLTVNELRAEQGYEALTQEIGNAPLNPSLLAIYMQTSGLQQANEATGDAQQQDEEEDFGDVPAAGKAMADGEDGEDKSRPSRAQNKQPPPNLQKSFIPQIWLP